MSSGRLFRLTRHFSSMASISKKVTILGAAGGIGQPLSLLLKAFPKSDVEGRLLLEHLALYDIANMGMSVDLSHISTDVKVTGHSGPDQLGEALQGASIVLIPAGVPRKPGMTSRDDLFNVNAAIVRDLSIACAKHCPKAHILVISNPVNATVPIAYETLRKHGIERPSVFGVTTLDIVRTKAFIGETLGKDPEQVQVQVIGGHSGVTIIPLITKLVPQTLQQDNIIQRVQYGGDEVVKAKAGGGSATLSMAYAAYQFFRDFSHRRGLIAYVRIPEHGAKYPSEYFATHIELDDEGKLKSVSPLPELHAKEKTLLEAAIPELQRDITKGKQFAQQ